MKSFATLDSSEWQAVFEHYQLREGVSAVIVEKDFWVVWQKYKWWEGDTPILVHDHPCTHSR